MNKYVITGRPHSGKTTLINKLSEKSFKTLPESAREVILEEKSRMFHNPGYNGVFPWTDLSDFERKVIEKQTNYEKNIKNNIYFLDRSLVDPMAYSNLSGIKPEKDIVERALYAGYKKIFFLEQLPFYNKDSERFESLHTANLLDIEIYKTYKELGFEVVRVPPLNIDTRVDFILKKIGF